MFKLTAVSHPNKSANSLLQSKMSHAGYLLITQQDEIIYANRQARHYLGLLSDEKLPFRQTFLSLITSMYQCSSANGVRYLICSPKDGSPFFQIRVEVLEQLVIDQLPIWIVCMIVIKSKTTAVTHATIS